LHINSVEQVADNQHANKNKESGSSNAPPNVVGCNIVNSAIHCRPTIQVILATVVVHVYDATGNVTQCRAVLDSGSQLCFVTSTMVRRLGLQITNNTVPIIGIGQSKSATSKSCMGIVQSRTDQTQFPVQLHVLPTITDNLPT